MIVPGLAEAASAQAACRLLAAAGHRVLFVGGVVRDALLGLPPGDIDLATDAPPERVIALAGAAGLRVKPTGIEHGTVTLLPDGRPIEVTTFRKDVVTFGRRAVVAFAASEADDARRRDFTINALYATPEGVLVDPLGALPDIRARRIRFVGDPATRIAEDHLRILRFFRFQASFAPRRRPDAEALAAITAATVDLARLSRERVGAEVRKLLAQTNPGPVLRVMEDCGVLDRILPGAASGAVARLTRLERRHGIAPAWQRRLFALLPGAPSPDIRLSRVEARRFIDRQKALASPLKPAALAACHGEAAALDALLLRVALFGGAMPRGWRAALRRGSEAGFPLRAADLAGLAPPGPATGQALGQARAAWLDHDLKLTRSQLLTLLAHRPC